MKYFFPLFIIFLFISCEDDPNGMGGENSVTTTFDRQAMLTNWTDEIIIPAYQTFAIHTQNLQAAAEDFSTEASETNLVTLRTAWEEAYIQWQRVSMFEIGKAEELDFRNQMNIYPADSEAIINNIETGDYNFALPSTLDEQGFPALDYLLNGVEEDQAAILTFYSADTADKYRKYIVDITIRMNDLTKEVLQDWTNSFRVDFIENSGNSATASVDKMVNDYLFYYEKSLRAGKVGIPAGVFSGDPLSDRVEALYAEDLSKKLLLTALQATRSFFNGSSNRVGQDGESLFTYLEALEIEKDGVNLGVVINNQFDAARDEIEKLEDNLRAQVETDNIGMLTAYDALQLNVINMKIDMLQALNINVDYVDADGD